MSELEQKPNTTSDLISEAQLKKLELEIEDLERKKANEKVLKRILTAIPTILPAITIILAILGFWDGYRRYQNEQEQRRIVEKQQQIDRLQNQLRSDYQELLGITTSENQTVSRASFLLEDMNSLIQRLESLEPKENSFRRSVTKSLMTLVKYDTMFLKEARDVDFANTVFGHWEDYRNYLKAEPSELNDILYLYIRSFRHLHDQDKRYFETIHLDEKNEYVVIHEDEKEEIRFLHFTSLIEGFIQHLGLLEDNSELRSDAIQSFHQAINNTKLTERIFGSNVIKSSSSRYTDSTQTRDSSRVSKKRPSKKEKAEILNQEQTSNASETPSRVRRRRRSP